jgi:hypothetical protein
MYDLFCQWCECEQDSWAGSNKDEVSEDEKAAMRALQSVRLDGTTGCQVKLEWWEGRIDFYHIPSKTAMQADGSSHFERMHHRAPHLQLLMDIECCGKAWEGGRGCCAYTIHTANPKKPQWWPHSCRTRSL